MKVIAKRGDNSYLVQTSENRARVADMDQNVFYPEFNLLSILARGYWEDYDDTDGSKLKEILAEAKEPEKAGMQ